MGTRERHDRERQAVRDAILTAARELFVAEGYRNVSMRKIAERIEYSPAAIYGYFDSKDAIFFALAEEGFRLIAEASRAAKAGVSDPLDAMRRMFLSYYRFSREHPQFFELMFLDRTVPQLSEHWNDFAFVHEAMQGAIGVVQQAVDAGVLPAGSDPAAIFHVLWAAIHGPAAIALCARHAPGENPEALAHDALDAAIAGLRAGVRPTFVPDCHAFTPVGAQTEEAPHVPS